MKNPMRVVGVAVLIALAIAAVWWWQRGPAPTAPPPAPSSAAAPAAPVAQTEPGTPPVAASGPKYPIEPPVTAEPGGSVPADFDTALTDLFGRKAVLGMFQTDVFAQRLAATVDNLGRERATTRLWPVNPAGGRFTVDRQGDAEVIGADNGLRYKAYVALLENADLRKIVRVYASLYPRLQRAYEELGYPGRNFNDRVVEVIDQLLATPEPTGPLRVRIPTVGSPVKPVRPWVLYEFDDPALEALSAGQKILLRMGPANERQVKARLAELRRLLTNPASAR